MMKAITKKVTKKFVEIDGVEVSYYDMLELVSEIRDVDGMFNALVIYDDKMAEVLVMKGVASKTVRGSYSCKSEAKRKALAKELYALEESFAK